MARELINALLLTATTFEAIFVFLTRTDNINKKYLTLTNVLQFFISC